jgi:hypothetical protein
LHLISYYQLSNWEQEFGKDELLLEVFMEQITQTTKQKKGFSMNFTKRKKILILVGMFALLAVTGFLNFTLNQEPRPTGGGQQTTQSFFTTFHAQRADERAASIAILTSMSAADSGYSAEIRANAAQQLLTFLAAIQYENTTEGLIKAQDFDDAIVMKTNGNVNVVIKSDADRDKQTEVVPNILRVIRDQWGADTFGEFDIERVFVSFMA